jgi:hypothetical protein
VIDFLSADGVFAIALTYVVMFTLARLYWGHKLAKTSPVPSFTTYAYKPLPLIAIFLLADFLGDNAVALKCVATTLCLFFMFQSAFKVGGLRGALARINKYGKL